MLVNGPVTTRLMSPSENGGEPDARKSVPGRHVADQPRSLGDTKTSLPRSGFLLSDSLEELFVTTSEAAYCISPRREARLFSFERVQARWPGAPAPCPKAEALAS